MRAYKVVALGRDGRMHSLVRSRALRRTYKMGVMTRPVEGTRLLVFIARDSAQFFMNGLGLGRDVALLAGEAQELRPQSSIYPDGFDTSKSSAVAFWKKTSWDCGMAPDGTYSCESFRPDGRDPEAALS